MTSPALQTADVGMDPRGTFDGMGEPSVAGPYVILSVEPKGEQRRRYKIARGAAEMLRDELSALLRGMAS